MTATAFISRPAWGAAWAACLLATAGTRAEVVVLSVDPVRSALQLRGSVAKNGLNLLLNPQRDGALHTTASGQLRVELTPGAVRFVDDDTAAGLTLADSGVWQPDWFGAEGAAPACWGALAGANLGFIRIAGLAAGRFWGFTVTSTNSLAVTNGGFGVRPVRWHFAPPGGPVVDYRFLTTYHLVDPDNVFPPPARPPQLASSVPAPVLSAGRFELSGTWTNRTALRGQLATENGLPVLTLPLELWTSFSGVTPAGETLRFDWILGGQLVAVAVPPLRLTAVPEGLRLEHHPTLRLQRATRLDPPDWADFPTPADGVIARPEAAGFFRGVLGPAGP